MHNRYHSIKFHDKELIEDSTTSDNIPYDRILGKCAVFKAREHESLTELLQTDVKYPMAYVYRYKLVKDASSYRLEPVSWQADEEERRQVDEFSDFDTDTQSEPILDLNAAIEQIHRSFTNDSECGAIPQLQVSPFRIVNNTVCKATRNRIKTKADQKRSSPDAAQYNADVSPSKRNKLTDEYDSDIIEASPNNRTGKYLSPALDQMKKVKRNLSDVISSNLDATYDCVNNDKDPMKVTLRKKSNETKTPLKERNENTVKLQELSRASETPINSPRRTILRPSDSTRSKQF